MIQTRILGIAFILCCFVFSAKGQKLKIEGTIKDTTGLPLEMANILVLDMADSSMVTYGFSNDEGKYQLSLSDIKPYLLRISYLGYRQQDVLISPQAEQAKVFRNVIMQVEDDQLDVVEVVEEMPIVISGDTISYKADAFTDGNERKLDEVLEKLPGFEVDENGEVKVEGKTVEKVMVEGKDFFDGDTKLATKNIPANAVEKVQVLRNYNDIGPMQGVDNDDRIALNIKLKDGKKNLLFGDITAEGGLDERYLLHPNIFYYTPKASFNFIGDINNIGQPAFTFQDYFRFGGGFRSLNRRSGSNFNVAQDNLGFSLAGDNRADNIDSKLGALNYSWNPNKKWTVSGYFIASDTRTISSSLTTRTYLREGGADIDEVLSTQADQQTTSGIAKLSAKYAPNAALHIAYDILAKPSSAKSLNNQLSTFDTISSQILTRNTQQPYEISQNLEAFYEINANNILSLEAQHLYKVQDPLLDLIGPADFLNLGGSFSPPYQNIQRREIKTNKSDALLNHYYIFNKTNHINFTAGISHTAQAYVSSINNVVDGNEVPPFGTAFSNDVDYWLTDLFVSSHYKVKFGKLIASPGLNLHRYTTKDNQAQGISELQNDIYLLPDFFARYDFKKSSSLTFNYAMQAQYTDVNNIIEGNIINNYNTLFTGNRLLDNSLLHTFTLGYYNFNMFNFTNIYAGANYSRKINDITNLVANSTVSRLISPLNSEGVNDLATIYGSYGRRFWKLEARVRTNLSLTNTNTLVDNSENRNQTFTQNYSGSLRTRFKKAPNVELKYAYIRNTYEGGNVSNTFITYRPSVEVEAVFLKHFTFEADYTYNDYRNEEGTTASNYDFLNATLYFQKDKSPWEFKLGVLNLLNTDIIRQDNFSDFLISTSEYNVLPRYVTAGIKYEL